MQQILFDGIPVLNPLNERLTSTVDLSRVNSLVNPLGRSPCKGQFLLSRSHLDSLDLNGLHKVRYVDNRWGEVTAYNLIIVREPQKIHFTSNTGEEQSCFLIEVGDRRAQLHNPIYCQSVNKAFNVRESSSSYYTDTTNGGTPWTWAEMVEDIWGTMAVLGTFPELPVTPTGTPENWVFQGVSAWASLCMVLEQIGCAVQCDLTKETGQYTIIELADTDPPTTTLLDRLRASHRLLHDAEFQPVVRARVPYGVRVFFHSVRADAWTPTGGVYTVDVVGPDVQTAESSIYHPVWSDIPALYDSGGSLTNAATLATVAAEVADDFYKRIRGGGNRDYLCFDGAVSLAPGPLTRVITWRQNPLPLAEEGGIVTEIIRHPFSAYMEGMDCCFEDSTALHPPDLRIEKYGETTTFENVTITGTLKLLDSATVTFINTLVTWVDTSLNTLLKITADGYIITSQDEPIDDSRLDSCEASFYVDCTAGSPSIKWVIKDENGDVYTFYGTITSSIICSLIKQFPGYNGSVEQYLGHDASGNCKWFNVGELAPGSACESAAPIEMGVTYGPFVLAPGEHWFKIESVPSGDVHMRLINASTTADDMDDEMVLYRGDDCGDLAFAGSLGGWTGTPADYCHSGNVLAGTFWIKIKSVAGTLTYSVLFDTGTCP